MLCIFSVTGESYFIILCCYYHLRSVAIFCFVQSSRSTRVILISSWRLYCSESGYLTEEIILLESRILFHASILITREHFSIPFFRCHRSQFQRASQLTIKSIVWLLHWNDPYVNLARPLRYFPEKPERISVNDQQHYNEWNWNLQRKFIKFLSFRLRRRRQHNPTKFLLNSVHGFGKRTATSDVAKMSIGNAEGEARKKLKTPSTTA